MMIRASELQNTLDTLNNICKRCCKASAGDVPCSTVDCAVLFAKHRNEHLLTTYYRGDFEEFLNIVPVDWVEW